MSEGIIKFEEEITPEEEAITPSFQPSPEMEISPEAETCESFFGGMIKICSKLDINARIFNVRIVVPGQSIRKIQLNANITNQNVNFSDSTSKNSINILVDWNDRKIKVRLKHCRKRLNFFGVRWGCTEINSVLAKW
ncbi:hypothetical protein [Candidatus Nitrosocosmicus hydrocola]|uniref:hypothetical protein n=1 Tax=Candidatus Nitrosocosmicus hydrocola TaxID=1826872 RepID=UPI0011E5C0F0|nr:hypothetical protein [Candidatus Nitrosocosmicus hydrocola]